ncbi:uncharacterized protein B0T15DRAFT_557803 [Chaetomium strumarium]|uniref:Uncharacterized protein n=1 Tax=Chaetomium strumarium TaxID=1170767 RepID=A0AAJ0M0C8_9PEZI|nr:hypothetical protein B0T15DRAFT_557803 [Chaetomium strumarium]
MRAWLVAKAEEDKRRQEEEKTRQESYRLEQRRMEHEILRTSLQGGIPPPLVPVVFAGMGGGALSPAALEWAQQFMLSQSPQQQPPPALMLPGAVPSEHQRRDSQSQVVYGRYPVSGGVPSTPGSAQGPPSAYMSGYPGSPTRPRGQSMPGAMAGRSLVAGGSTLPNLNTTNLPGGPGGGPGITHQPALAQSQQQQQHQEPQASPSIYFHHWQPPTTQAGGRGGTDQPATPSANWLVFHALGESPRKRKAPGPQQPAPPPAGAQRLRSPPFAHSSGLSNPPPGRRRGGGGGGGGGGHSRQSSDLGSYRGAGGSRGRGESVGPGRELSPMHTSGASAAREGGGGEPVSSSTQQHQPQVPPFVPPRAPAPSAPRTGAHSVSSLLSDAPPSSPRATAAHFAAGPQQQPEPRTQQQQQYVGENGRRDSPRASEDERGGRANISQPSAR